MVGHTPLLKRSKTKENKQAESQSTEPSQPEYPDDQAVQESTAKDWMPIRSQHVPAPASTPKNRQQSQNDDEEETTDLGFHNVCVFVQRKADR